MSIVNDAKLSHLVRDPECKLDRHVNELNWAVVKFVSPENMIEKKQIFDLNRFLFHEVNRQLVDICNNVCLMINNEFSRNLDKKIEELEKNLGKKSAVVDSTLGETIKVCKALRDEMKLEPDNYASQVIRQYGLNQEELVDRFETYKVDNHRELLEEFGESVTRQTCLRGFKVSGAFETLAEAKERAKLVTEEVEPYVQAGVVPLNVWVPWDPHPDLAKESVYQLEELNDLMSKKRENEAQRKEFFEKRTRMMIDKARQENNSKLRASL